MTNSAPVSLCIIVKNEPFLEKCLQSLRPYLKEIVVVDTGSTDGTDEVAKRYADIFENFQGCNDPKTGLIEDFSMARQRSFDLATQPWVLWCDADDLIEGGQNLNAIIQDYETNYKHLEGISYLFPYEYAYNAEGQCTLKHYRERLFYNKSLFQWVNPVHEVCIPKDNSKIALLTREDLVYKHHRQFSPKVHEPGRNLRILKNYYEKVGDSDARQLYYLGLECANAGLVEEAVKHLSKYIDISGWEDERVMACMKLVEIYHNTNNLEESMKWGFKAIEIKEDWSEGYLALARTFYFLGMRGGSNEMRNWQKCIYFGKAGLALPPTKTLLFINPMERDSEIYKYLNLAYNKLGRVQEALDCVNIGMLAQPNDPNFLNNKKLYEDFLARQRIIDAANVLKKNATIGDGSVEQINAIINNQTPNSQIATVNVNTVLDNKFPVANKTNNQQDWAIPEQYDFESFPLKMTDEQIQAVVIMVWKQYMLHDEVLSAISFLENAPYNVKHTYATQKALKLTKDCLVWMDVKEDFQKVNAPSDPEREAGNPLPNKLILSEGHRFDLVADRLAPNSTIIDFGSMDGCFTNRYGMLGHKPTGLDVCESSVKLANKKALEFNTGATHVCTYFQEALGKVPNDHFDYATSTDTYEHLKDPVADMLVPAYQMLNSGGKFLLATPHGAWMRGQYLEWAHPWNWSREGKSWLQPSPRAHLIAPTQWNVVENFRKAGFWVKDCYADLCDPSFSDVAGQGNIFAEAHKETPANYPGKDIVFFIGDGVEEWTPNTVKKKGIGGSEMMAINQARNLVALGNRVRVYNSCGKYGEGIYDGVEYYQSNKYQDLECDVLIVSRRADMLADSFNIKAKIKLLWVHDVFAINATNEFLLKADRILALSEWHKDFMVKYHNVHPDHILVTRNGIDLTRFDKKVTRNKFKCVNSSSPDRSWPILLDVWPEIKKQVPQAELHLYYGFTNWKYSAQFDPKQMDLINFLEKKIKEMESLGVVYHDRVSQDQLSEEFLSAGCWIHPTWFTETSCITAMEAQAAGLFMITSNVGALKETVANRGVLIDGEWTSPEYKEKFIVSVVKALKKSGNSERLSLQQYAKKNFDLQDLAMEWETLFNDLEEELVANPISPYYPTMAYRKNEYGYNGYISGDPRLGGHNKLKASL